MAAARTPARVRGVCFNLANKIDALELPGGLTSSGTGTASERTSRRGGAGAKVLPMEQIWCKGSLRSL
jgi:hypothetical protein